MSRLLRRSGLVSPRVHIYLIVAVTFVALLLSAGQRSAPSVLMDPLRLYFAWDRATISFAAAMGIFFYGIVGPFAAALMASIGIRRTMIGGMILMSVSTFASLWMTESWQYVVTWGLVSGIGTGAVAPVLGAAIVNRWFAKHQGLIIGMLSASAAAGTLVFLPVLAWLSTGAAWRPVVTAVSIACLALVPLIMIFVPEAPKDIGTTRFGEEGDHVPEAAPKNANMASLAIGALVRASRQPTFWLLFGTFFICGLTTNGLVSTHMIAFCGDHGVAAVAAGGLLSLMGLFDLIGTTFSGWLTDRFDSRKLLVIYYALRGLSLMVVPFLQFDAVSLTIFAVVYGLDWVATLPPTVKLANEAFGEVEAPIVFGWIVAGHQLGAAVAAFGAGLIREESGSYTVAFVVAGMTGVLAAVALFISSKRTPSLKVATAIA